MTLDDLAARAKDGDRAALEALVRGLSAPLYNLAVRMLGDREHARDATQEILILVITQLSSFRGESAVSTWAYRVASRHLVKQRRRGRKWTFTSLEEDDLGQPPNAIDAATLAVAEERVLEEQIFLGCTQAMLQALDADDRIAFVLGAICELSAANAAYVLEVTEAAFRKRLSRARAKLDAFLARACGVANPANRCRCAYQVNYNVARGLLDPAHPRFAVSATKTSLEVVRALAEIDTAHRALQLYTAQPDFEPTEDFAARVRGMLDGASWS